MHGERHRRPGREGYGSLPGSRLRRYPAGRRQITREWFVLRADGYELCILELVATEAPGGDELAVKDRVAFLEGIPRLWITDAAGKLAGRLVETGAVPRKATADALHIAVAAVHGVDDLLTWNCGHIANARMRQAIEHVCREVGCEPPVICTPEELTDEERN